MIAEDPAGTPGPEHRPRSPKPIAGSLWRSPALLRLLAYSLPGFTGFFITSSSLPAWLAAGGTPDGAAGLVTTVLLVCTVGMQLLIPRLVERFGTGPVLIGGAIALGGPTPLLLIDDQLWWVLVVSAIRGAGFAALTVLGAMLVARIVPVGRRGEAIGIYGLAIAIPGLLAVPGGVALVTGDAFVWVAVIGAAPLLGLPAALGLARAAGPADAESADAESADVEPDDADPDDAEPDDAESVDAKPDDAEPAAESDDVDRNGDAAALPGARSRAAASRGTADGAAVSRPAAGTAAVSRRAAGRSAASRRAAARAAALPALVLLVVTLAGGAFSTFLPIERPTGSVATVALLLFGLTGAVARWRAGVLADRNGLRIMLPAAVLITVVGMVATAAGLHWAGAGDVTVLVGAAVLGVGYGASQNLTLVAAFERSRHREAATVSSVWNVGFDSGTAIGAALVGALIPWWGIPGGLLAAGLLAAAFLPAAVISARRPG